MTLSMHPYTEARVETWKGSIGHACMQAFNEIKNYYNDITSNNLDLIKTLKEDVAEMKKKEALNEKLMYEISTENKRLSEPLNRALKVNLAPASSQFDAMCTWTRMVSQIA